MKANIHPEYHAMSVTCSCGNRFTVGSALGTQLHTEVCDKCHPFYTGKQRIVDTANCVGKFNDRYKKSAKTKTDEIV